MVGSTVPRFSIVTPVFNPPPDAFEACVRSVLGQTFTNWQWCLCDDASSNQWIKRRLLELQASDTRIRTHLRVNNGGIASASNDALALATGDFLALLDDDDMLHVDALLRVNEILNDDPSIDYIYTDEDKIDELGNHYDVFKKPRWSPQRFLGQNYCSHLSVIRRSLVDDVGRFRDGFDGSQDYDLFLRVTERTDRIVHLPEVLYHWRAVSGSTALGQSEKSYAFDAALRAVQTALERRGVSATVAETEPFAYQRVIRSLNHEPRISIVIPTCGTHKSIFGVDTCLVVNCVESILTHTNYSNFEVLVIIDNQSPSSVWQGLRGIIDSRLNLIEYDKPFNFSAKCNLGAVLSDGEYVLLLNDDTEIIDPEWLRTLAGYLEEPDVAMVGPMLLLEDGRIQSAGHSNTPSPHNFRMGSSAHSAGEFGVLAVARECSGITAACALIRRRAFDQVGGLSEIFPKAFNDVDLCFKLLEAGYRIIWTPHTHLFHFESASRPKDVEQSEVILLNERWERKFDQDEYCRLE